MNEVVKFLQENPVQYLATVGRDGGRNTMGGLIKVHTRSPFSYQGTDVKLSYGTKSNYRSASLTHYHRWTRALR